MAVKERYYDIIRSPIITEKSTMASANGQIVFEVRIDATKPLVKQAIEGLFNVKVKAVNTNVRKGKTKRFRGRIGQQKTRKYAVVTLEDGHTLDVTTGL